MSVIAFKDIQATAAAQLAASDYLTSNDVQIIVDDGRKLSAVEEALSNKGHCVVVGLPLNAQRVGQATGAANVRVRFEVMALLNPETSELDPVETFTEIARTILGYTVTNQADRFELAEGNDSIFEPMEGLFFLSVKFNKLAFIKA